MFNPVDVDSAGAKGLDWMSVSDTLVVKDETPDDSREMCVEPIGRLGGAMLLSHSVVPYTTE